VARLCQSIEQPTAAPGDVNHALLDSFSLVHVAAGVVFGALGLPFVPMLVLAFGWEIAEHLLKDCIPGAFVHPTQDTLLNAAGDIVVALLGWALGRAARLSARNVRHRRGARTG
jgi:hypothetical protein